MESTGVEALILQDKPFTIREYADYVLSLPQIKQALEALTVYQTVVDRMIDSWHDMVETEKVPFRVETTHEELALQDILKDMGNVKKVAVKRIMDPIFSPLTSLEMYHCHLVNGYGMRWIDKFVRNRTSEDLCTISECLFKQFTLMSGFREYLLTGEIPFIQRGTALMDKQEELSAVFSLFLWIVSANREGNIFSCYSPFASFDRCHLMLLDKYNDSIRLDNTGRIRLSFDSAVWCSITIGQDTTSHLVCEETLGLLDRLDMPVAKCATCLKPRANSPWFILEGAKIVFCSLECLQLFKKQ